MPAMRPSHRSLPGGGGAHRRVPFPEGASQFPSQFAPVQTFSCVFVVALTSTDARDWLPLNGLPDG